MDRLTSEASAPAKPYALGWSVGLAALLLAGCDGGAGSAPSPAPANTTGTSATGGPDQTSVTATPDAHETPSTSEKPMPAQPVDGTRVTTPSASGTPDTGDAFWNLGAGSRTHIGFSLNPQMTSGTALFLCDALEQSVVLALTVLITGRPKQGQLRYRTFNDGASLPILTGETVEQGTQASLDLTGGRHIGDAFVFTNKGYSYRLTTDGNPQLMVSRDGKVIQTEPLLAWTVGGSSSARP